MFGFPDYARFLAAFMKCTGDPGNLRHHKPPHFHILYLWTDPWRGRAYPVFGTSLDPTEKVCPIIYPNIAKINNSLDLFEEILYNITS